LTEMGEGEMIASFIRAKLPHGVVLRRTAKSLSWTASYNGAELVQMFRDGNKWTSSTSSGVDTTGMRLKVASAVLKGLSEYRRLYGDTNQTT
jgi:hypothetical protein